MLGFHISITSKNLLNSIKVVYEGYSDVGANAFQVFLKNPKSYRVSNIPQKQIELARDYIKENEILFVSHGTYLLNSANPDKFEKKMLNVIDDLMVIDSLGGIGSVFHVGKSLKMDVDEAVANMKEFIEKAIVDSGKLGCKSAFILETGAGCGTECLTKIEDLGAFYHSFDEKVRERMRICIDTCHVFSAGYDLRNEECSRKFVELVEKHIGWDNVALIHLNDSKYLVGSCKDRHENLLKGHISKECSTGLEFFVKFCYEKRIPIVMETPVLEGVDSRKEEMELLNSWIGRK